MSFEPLEARCLLAVGSIQGNVWNDADADGERDAVELGIAGRTILLDTNSNQRADSGELTAVTDADGNYLIANVPEGNYAVTLISQPAWRQSSPETSRTTGRLFYSSGFIRELNPLTGAVLNEFPSPILPNGAGNEALAVGPDSLFFTDSSSASYPDGTSGSPVALYEVDPDTGAVIDFDVLAGYVNSGMGGTAYLNGEVYLLGANKLVVWDPVSDTVVREVPFSIPPSGFLNAPTALAAAPDLGVVFAASYYDVKIYRLDPHTGALLGSFSSQFFGGVGAVMGLAYYHGELYALSANKINRFDPSTGALLGTITVSPGSVVGGLGGDGASNPGAHEITIESGVPLAGVDFGTYAYSPPSRSQTPPTPSLLTDTGVSGSDRHTRNNNSNPATPLNFRISPLTVGSTLTLLDNWVPVASMVVTSRFGTQLAIPSGQTLADGIHLFSTRVVEPGKLVSYTASAAPVKIDTVGPVVTTVYGPAAPVAGSGVSEIQLSFDEFVAQIDISDLSLSRDGGPNLLTGAQTTSGNALVRVLNLASITSTPGYYVLSFAAGQNIIDRAGNPLVPAPIVEFVNGVFGDIDANGVLDNFDIQAFERALTNPAGLLAERPQAIGYHLRGDIDGDGDFDNFDIQPFELLLTNSGLAASSGDMLMATPSFEVSNSGGIASSGSIGTEPSVGDSKESIAIAHDAIFRALASNDDANAEAQSSAWWRRSGRRATWNRF